ncbi:SDR family NAD(P)-dependent oxidoreductase [Thalassotalea mangrovi]|uniref:SDR family oxidoreductase n=1 Tax=Thalassotalea mangrovi TaxID=2572245 RepID=A0A4U1B183_9GAMM|nr:SDR family oxidoreductase [Thalassotalea mangrovi]TKB43067.1 SDR family oxidoreductase [Thalassotalea mangrovi]
MKDINYLKLFSLAGKRALITGAGRSDGIGAAIAKGLADCGAEVIIHDHLIDTAEVATRIRESGGKCHTLSQDLSVKNAGRDLIASAYQRFGDIDILVLNASYQVVGDFADVSNDDFEQQININLRSNFEILQDILPRMKHQGWGRVVNIGSVNQRSPKSIVSIYAAAKAAINNLIQSLARDYAAANVLLNTVAPGLVDTYPQKRANDPQAEQAWDDYARQLNWVGRAAQPEEIVGAVLYLASPACSFMAGESLFVTGGFTGG